MSHAGRIVKILLEDAPEIGGEYWIIDGDVAFADGDVGDVNHEAYAVDHARRITLDYFNQDSDGEIIDDNEMAQRISSSLQDEGIQFDPDQWFAAAYAFAKNAGADEKTLATLLCACDRGADAREVAMKYWGWKWCRKSNISTWTFTDADRKSIIRGINQIIEQEMNDDAEDWNDLEITIGVGSNGRRMHMTLGELEAGRNVSRDPTWGGMTPSGVGESQEEEDADMLDYMVPEIKRLTSKRKFKVGEEVSHGTYNTIDLCRRGLAKLEELDYAGHERFISKHRDTIENLVRVESSLADEQDFNGDDAVDAHEDIERIWEALCELFDSYCPPGTFFGSNEGSASCYGCWPNEQDTD